MFKRKKNKFARWEIVLYPKKNASAMALKLIYECVLSYYIRFTPGIMEV